MDSDKVPPDVGKLTTSGGIVMEKRNDTYVQMLLPEIEAMITAGKSQSEMAEQFGFKDK